jgi:CRP-like cAMP-binding protein/Zn-dependent protease
MKTVRPGGLWEGLTEETRRKPARRRPPRNIWSEVHERIDPAQIRPKLADDIEVKEHELRWGSGYAIICNPRDLLHYKLEPAEVELLQLMDGTRTVGEIVVERFRESGDLELSGVTDLVFQLHAGNFLDSHFVDVEESLARAVKPPTTWGARVAKFAKTLKLEWKGADRLVRWLYEHGVKWFFTWPAQVVGGALAVLGLLAFFANVRSDRFDLSGSSLALGFLILLGLQLAHIFLHELGHATVLVHYGRRVNAAGFLIYFGAPAFFVESSDGLMLDQRERIIQSTAGPYVGLLVAGAFSIGVWLVPTMGLAPLLYRFTVLAYLVVFMNSLPMLELDGYWILADAIQVPDLRPRSLSFVRHDLWRKLARRLRFTPQEIGLALYGVIGIAFTVFSFYTAYFFWEQVFGGLVRRMWNGGVGTRILLLALALFVAGPLIRGGIRLLQALFRELRKRWRAIRFRLETAWRVEAAELIDALPLFRDLPVEVLNDLSGRVRLRSAAQGEAVVRQGDRANAMYVVRSGSLQVVEEGPDHREDRVLRTLGRGESFGELGLVEAAPRTATVRAIEPAELFEIDKSTFDRLLADQIRLPDFAPTVQALTEIRELAPFSHLEPDELAAVMKHGGWANYPPGETILREGRVGDAFYAIRSGQVEVLRGRRRVRVLGPGAYFGEVALLLDVPRTASVRALTPVRAFRLDRKGFDRLIRRAFRRGGLRTQIEHARTMEH